MTNFRMTTFRLTKADQMLIEACRARYDVATVVDLMRLGLVALATERIPEHGKEYRFSPEVMKIITDLVANSLKEGAP